MKIVVFCPNWVGDAVMATPTLRALRSHFPEAHISGLMLRTIADTLAGNPWLDQNILLDDGGSSGWRRWTGVVKRLRRERFDLAILLTNSILTGAVSWFGNAARRVGYDRECRGLLLTDRLDAGWTWRGYRPNPLIDYYLRIAEHVGAKQHSRQMELFVEQTDRVAADELWQRLGIHQNQPVVALNPGAAFGPAKRWPVESFSELARRLVDERRTKVIVMCGPQERDLARQIALGSERSSSVFPMSDEKISIGLSKAIIAKSSLLVSTDSGPRHFAPAFGVPIVALFGPTHIEWTETYYPGEVKLQKSVPCGPCQRRVCPQGHHRCMKELGVDDVFRAATRLLDDSPQIGGRSIQVA
jgi:heptosyltransferase-2